MNEAFIGVDVGTGSARAGVFDAEGRLLGVARRSIDLWQEAGGIVEQSSSQIWNAVCAAVGEAVVQSNLRPAAIAGIGFDATCSLVVLDGEGRSLPVGPSGDPARDVIVWMDHRAVNEANAINAEPHEVLRYVGGRISPEMQLPKLLWLSRRLPDSFRNAGHFFDLTDFLTWRATGELARSICTIVCKWTYLAHERRWDAEFLRRVDLAALADSGFARIGASAREPGEALGHGLTQEAARAMALLPGTPVAAGLIDAHAGALGTMGAGLDGMAADRRRRLALILGTSACTMALSDDPRFIPGVWGPYFSAVTPRQWLTEGGQSSFGAAIDHMMRLHPAFARLSTENGDRVFERMESDILARAGSLSDAVRLAGERHVLPDFLGNRSPFADAGAHGAVMGVDLAEDYESLLALYVATLNGLAQGIAQIVRALEAGGYAFDMLVASGGAARSRLVVQTIADVTGIAVGLPEAGEPVLLGSAMLGAIASGRHSMESAMKAMSRLTRKVDPAGSEIAAIHARRRQIYEMLQDCERSSRAIMRSVLS